MEKVKRPAGGEGILESIRSVRDEKHMLLVDVADFGGEWRLSRFGGNLAALLAIAPFMQGMIPSVFLDEFLGEIDLEAEVILA